MGVLGRVGYRTADGNREQDSVPRFGTSMRFSCEHYLAVCAEEFARILDLGADGILFDKSLHHTPALLCFDSTRAPGRRTRAHQRPRADPPAAQQAADPDFLFAGEAVYDWQFDTYQLSYHRSEDPRHLPLSRYLLPHAPIMTAVTGFDDRDMVNQCLLYRYVISYEPHNFKGPPHRHPRTVQYGQIVDRLRTDLRGWFWDGTFTGTAGATVLDADTAIPHHPYSVFHVGDGRPAAVVVNNDPAAGRTVQVDLDGHDGKLRHRTVDNTEWRHTNGTVHIPPRPAVVVIPGLVTALTKGTAPVPKSLSRRALLRA